MPGPDAAPAHPNAIVVVMYPDVRKTPKPAPYQSVAKLVTSVGTHTTVQIHGFPATSLRTHVPMISTTPPFPGAKSNVSSGQSFPILRMSTTVMADGTNPIVRRGTIYGINSAGPMGPHNTQGRVVYLTNSGQAVILDDGSISGSMAPPMSLADVHSLEDLQRFADQTKAGVQELGRQIGQAAQQIEDKYQVTTRALGAVQSVGGGAEAFVGGACVYVSAGVGAVLGCGVLTLHGLDNVQAGARTAFSGTSVPTYTFQGVNNAALYAGYSETTAHVMATGVDSGISFLTPAGAAQIAKAEKAAAELAALNKAKIPGGAGGGSGVKVPGGAGAGGAGADGTVVGPRPPMILSEAEGGAPHKGGNLYRGDKRSTEEIMRDGFKAKDPNGQVELANFTGQNNPSPSQWISTSSDPNIASNPMFAGFDGRVAVLNETGGVNVNAALGEFSIHPGELEVAFSRAIPPENIAGVFEIDRITQTINFVPNPNYTGPALNLPAFNPFK